MAADIARAENFERMPLVSVVIPTYKRPADLKRAIQSVLAQTMPDFEIVVAVDGDDPTAAPVVADFADPRLRLVRSATNNGAGATRNLGADASVGTWIAFLDDDDEWLPEKLAKQLALRPDPSNTISMTQSYVIGKQGTVILPTTAYDGREPFDEWLFCRRSWFGAGGTMVQPSSLMMPRELFKQLRFGQGQHEEWEFMIRATKQLGYRLQTVEEPLVKFYVGRTYPWSRSLIWIDKLRDLVTPRAYSSFLLTVVTQTLRVEGSNRDFLSLLRRAWNGGQPDGKQLFAFFGIWLIPHGLRQKIRAQTAKSDGLS